MLLWLVVLAFPLASAASLCEPAPTPDDLPPAASAACEAAQAPTPKRLRPEAEGSCGRLHRRLLAQAAREFEEDLDPLGRLMGPLKKLDPPARVAGIWNEDAGGREACRRSPQIVLCDALEREAWLRKVLAQDASDVASVRELYTWFVQARQACVAARDAATKEAVAAFESDRKRLSAGLRRALARPKDAARLEGLKADYDSRTLDPEELKGWDASLAAWAKSLARGPRTSAAPGSRKARPKAAEAAPPE